MSGVRASIDPPRGGRTVLNKDGPSGPADCLPGRMMTAAASPASVGGPVMLAAACLLALAPCAAPPALSGPLPAGADARFRAGPGLAAVAFSRDGKRLV